MLGLVRGVVKQVTDPSGRGRIQVIVPTIASGDAIWALTCLPPATSGSHRYKIGDQVWVAFENGDVSLPIVMGRMTKPTP